MRRELICRLTLPSEAEFAVSAEARDFGRWSEIQVDLRRAGTPALTVQVDNLHFTVGRMLALLRSAQSGTLPQHLGPDPETPLGLLSSRDAYELPDVVTTLTRNPFCDYAFLGAPGIEAYLYARGNDVIIEVSPACKYLFGDWPDDFRKAKVEEFFANFKPYLVELLPPATLAVWADTLQTLMSRIDAPPLS